MCSCKGDIPSIPISSNICNLLVDMNPADIIILSRSTSSCTIQHAAKPQSSHPEVVQPNCRLICQVTKAAFYHPQGCLHCMQHTVS